MLIWLKLTSTPHRNNYDHFFSELAEQVCSDSFSTWSESEKQVCISRTLLNDASPFLTSFFSNKLTHNYNICTSVFLSKDVTIQYVKVVGDLDIPIPPPNTTHIYSTTISGDVNFKGLDVTHSENSYLPMIGWETQKKDYTSIFLAPHLLRKASRIPPLTDHLAPCFVVEIFVHPVSDTS